MKTEITNNNKVINQLLPIYAIRHRYIALVIFGLFGFLASVYAQNTNYCEQAANIVKSANKFHYNPRPIDDQFADLLLPQFVELLDPYGNYLTKADIAQLEAIKHNIDNDITSQNCTFLETASALYQKRLLFADSLLATFQDKKFTFLPNDTITFKRESEYLAPKQLTGKWEKLIKLQILSSYYSNLDSLHRNKKPTPEELAVIKNKVIANQICRVKSKLTYKNGVQAFVGSCFLKTVSTTFDPHTNYFSETEEQEFEGLLSKEVNSFGLDIERNDMGEIEIVSLVPGSSAWSSNAINEGDIILKIKAQNIEKEFGCIALDEVASFLNSKDINEAEFLIRKKNGKEVALTLNKSRIEVQENIIRSFVLDGRTKIGYIYLPSFYTQSEEGSQSYKGCASDVAKELIKLKNENINGLIIDLRDNGGGSMQEALWLSGIFIDYGAVSIIDSRYQGIETLKDLNKGTIYNAPLLVLINQFSASASELFAAAMQDQNRAVIVGAQSYGKATMQQIIPVDAYRFETPEKYVGTPNGYLKLTTGAFYRVNGTSHQKTGVVPDIKLPTVYNDVDLSERAEKTALDTKPIDKKSYYFPLPAQPLQKLSELSAARIKQDSAFIEVENAGKALARNYNKIAIPLSIDGFGKFYNDETTTEQPQAPTTFNVKNPSYFNNAAVLSDSTENITTEISSDIYIGEAYNIINDLIKLNEKN
jgi:carboxyl-terminal processing protease